jgi:hypothetical protein
LSGWNNSRRKTGWIRSCFYPPPPAILFGDLEAAISQRHVRFVDHGMSFHHCLHAAILALSLSFASGAPLGETRPLMRDFIGVNGHTVQFKPEHILLQ